MADAPTKLSPEEFENLQGILGAGVLAEALRQGPDALAGALEIAEFGAIMGEEPDFVRQVTTEYFGRCNPATHQRALRRIMASTLHLPDKVVDLNAGVDDLLQLGADAAKLGDENLDALRDDANLEAIRKGGVSSAATRTLVLGSVAARTFGIPLEIARSQSIEKTMRGAVYASQIGFDEAVKDPEFWRDVDRPDEATAKKWFAKAEEHGRQEAARAEQQARELMAALWRERAKREEAEKARREELARSLREKDRKKRKKRKKKRPLGVVEIGNVRVEHFIERPVRSWGGSNYILRRYEDKSTALYRVDPDGRRLVLGRGFYAWYVLRDKSSALPFVMQMVAAPGRRSSPSQPGASRPGPAGR